MKSVGGCLEIQPGAHVYETTAHLSAGQTVEYGPVWVPNPAVDAERRSRIVPLSAAETQVSVSNDEIEGPIAPRMWPPPTGCFDELGVSPSPQREADRLLRRFLLVGGTTPGAGGVAVRATDIRPSRSQRVLRGSDAAVLPDLFLYLRETDETTSPWPSGFRIF